MASVQAAAVSVPSQVTDTACSALSRSDNLVHGVPHPPSLSWAAEEANVPHEPAAATVRVPRQAAHSANRGAPLARAANAFRQMQMRFKPKTAEETAMETDAGPLTAVHLKDVGCTMVTESHAPCAAVNQPVIAIACNATGANAHAGSCDSQDACAADQAQGVVPCQRLLDADPAQHAQRDSHVRQRSGIATTAFRQIQRRLKHRTAAETTRQAEPVIGVEPLSVLQSKGAHPAAAGQQVPDAVTASHCSAVSAACQTESFSSHGPRHASHHTANQTRSVLAAQQALQAGSESAERGSHSKQKPAFTPAALRNEPGAAIAASCSELPAACQTDSFSSHGLRRASQDAAIQGNSVPAGQRAGSTEHGTRGKHMSTLDQGKSVPAALHASQAKSPEHGSHSKQRLASVIAARAIRKVGRGFKKPVVSAATAVAGLAKLR